MKSPFLVLCLIFLAQVLFPQVHADDFNAPDFLFRALGPYRVGSWISDIAVPATDDEHYAYTYYVGARNGGIWKTENNGTSFFPVFDSQNSLSIGALAIAPSDPETIWAGTGEDFNARLSYYGHGIYKSVDGGDSWEHKGLTDAHHISVILIHPDDPDIIYTAVMGHLFTPNAERGVFKSANGGDTWERILFIDENTGVIDLVMDPSDPDMIFAATYEKYRYPWHFETGGENSGIYKTTNGGGSWQKLQNGLPGGKLGRIGLTIYPNNPDVMYSVIEII
ncbi:MAG: hypothetical protein P8100_07375, partial [bacterium]